MAAGSNVSDSRLVEKPSDDFAESERFLDGRLGKPLSLERNEEYRELLQSKGLYNAEAVLLTDEPNIYSSVVYVGGLLNRDLLRFMLKHFWVSSERLLISGQSSSSFSSSDKLFSERS